MSPVTARSTRSGSGPSWSRRRSTVFEDFEGHPQLVKGYIGPGVLGADKPAGVRYLLDPRVVEGTRWVTGADQPGGTSSTSSRGATSPPTAPSRRRRCAPATCARAAATPSRRRAASRWATSSSSARKYAEALGLKVLDENGKLVTVTMGSYGVGVSRAVAAVAEGNHDELGLCWPRAVAPADVHVVATGKDDAVFLEAQEIVGGLEAAGLEVLYDDRPKVSPGVKFKDSELIGVPTIVVVGRGLEQGTVEVKDRRSGVRREVPVDAAVAEVLAEVRGAPETGS